MSNPETTVAAIDCGTNSFRLLVAEPGSTGSLVELTRELEIVRLGQGVDATGELQPEALARTFAAAERCADRLRTYGVTPERTRVVATSAARDARNVEDFFAGMASRLGVRPVVISGSEEARLSFVGGNTYALSLDDARTLGLDPAKLRDYDGNDLGGAGGWRLNGLAVVRTDGALSYVLTNAEIGRWAEVTPQPGGGFNLANHGANGDARVVGNYLDPLVALGVVERGSAVDSQVRFAADLRANRLQVLGAGDFDRDGAIDLFWKQPDGNADPSNDIYLRAILHADGNIQYANYLNNDQFRGYMASAQVPHAVYDSWLKVS